MDYAGMQSLRQYLKQYPHRRIPEEEAKTYFKEIVEGLEYLH